MPETDSPLMILIRRLRSLGIPSLIALVTHLEGWEEYEQFVEIVRDFVPESEQEILNQSTPGAQIAVFADRFECRYFPLQDFMRGDVEEYAEITRGIPVVLLTFDGEDYHSATDFLPAYQLMTYLLAPPYSGDEGARVAWGEACAGVVPKELLDRVPEGGFAEDLITPLVEDTPYEGLALWCQAINWQTGNFFLDVTDEEFYYDMPDWSRATVEELTQHWQQAEVIQNKIKSVAEWLEEDPPKHFRELLDFLERKTANWDRDLMKLAGQLEMELYERR